MGGDLAVHVERVHRKEVPEVTREEKIHELEKKAICGDRMAILRIVGALRTYRRAGQRLLDLRWQDGACDGATVSVFEAEAEFIAADLAGEEGETDK